jgi:hypothetical protein
MSSFRGRRRSAARSIAALVMVTMVVSCSDDDDAAPSVSDTVVPADCEARQPVLRVDLIDRAVAAVEAELGGPQQYFEINATDLLVNLFVAVDDGAQAKPFVFLADELNSRDALPVDQGQSFAASALDFDPQKVTSCVFDELPESTATAFEILGGDGGAIGYSVIVDSASGGQLVVAVNGEGRILSVDPV